MSVTTLKLKEYPHYSNLPKQLGYNLSILRTNMYDYTVGSYSDIDCNDMEFLTLELLLPWVKETLPDFDCDFLAAASRIHKECYEDELFDYFGVEEEDLYVELLHIKDAYELKIAIVVAEKE